MQALMEVLTQPLVIPEGFCKTPSLSLLLQKKDLPQRKSILSHKQSVGRLTVSAKGIKATFNGMEGKLKIINLSKAMNNALILEPKKGAETTSKAMEATSMDTSNARETSTSADTTTDMEVTTEVTNVVKATDRMVSTNSMSAMDVQSTIATTFAMRSKCAVGSSSAMRAANALAASAMATTSAMGSSSSMVVTSPMGSAMGPAMATTSAVGLSGSMVAKSGMTSAMGSAKTMAMTSALGSANRLVTSSVMRAPNRMATTRAIGAPNHLSTTSSMGATNRMTTSSAMGSANRMAMTIAIGATNRITTSSVMGSANCMATTNAIEATNRMTTSSAMGSANRMLTTNAIGARNRMVATIPIGAANRMPTTSPIGAAIRMPTTSAVGPANGMTPSIAIGATSSLGAANAVTTSIAMGAANAIPTSIPRGVANAMPTSTVMGASARPIGASTGAMGASTGAMGATNALPTTSVMVPTSSMVSPNANNFSIISNMSDSAQKRRSSSRSIKRRKFDDELVESSLIKTSRQRPPSATPFTFLPVQNYTITAPQVQPENIFLSEQVLPEPMPPIMLEKKKPRPPQKRTKKPKNAQSHGKDIGRWKPTDDIELISAVLQTNDLETVYRGVKFSCKFTLQEIQERWYALLYDSTISKVAANAMKQLHADVITEINAKALFSEEEEKIIGTVLSSVQATVETFEELLIKHSKIFLPSRTAKVLYNHWTMMKFYSLLPDQTVQKLSISEHVASFSDVEEMQDDAELNDPKDEDMEREFRITNRSNLQEIRHLENEIPKWQVLVDSITGVTPADFDNHTLAILKGRFVRYLMRSKEISVGRSAKDQNVDIDLNLEGPAWKVSRRQGTIKLEKDGDFSIANEGKRPFYVDGKPVLSGTKFKLNNNSVVEIVSLRFVFLVNQELISALKVKLSKI